MHAVLYLTRSARLSLACLLCACPLLIAGCKAQLAKAPEKKPAEVFVSLPSKETVTEYEEFTGYIAAKQKWAEKQLARGFSPRAATAATSESRSFPQGRASRRHSSRYASVPISPARIVALIAEARTRAK